MADVFTDAKDYSTALLKDMNGYYETIIDAKDRETTITRDLDGRPTKITRFDNTYTQFQYNDYGDLVYKYDSESLEEENFVYNDYGDLISYTNPLNKTKTNTFNALGLVHTQTDYNGNTITRDYYTEGINQGQLKSVTNDKNETTFFYYDNYGLLERKVSPHGEETNYIRDLAGNIIEKINSNGVSTLYTYDEFNRLTSVATGVTANDPIGKLTTYEYTLTGQLAKIIDPMANETHFYYDEMDRLIKKISPIGQITELDYDGNGNVIWEKDPNGNIKTFAYDSDNLLTKKSLPDNLYEMSYDDYGNMLTITDNDSAIEFNYTKISKDYYVSHTKFSGSDIPSYELNYNYDLLGNRKLMESPFGDFNYSYDSGNRLTEIENHKNEFFGFEYDEVNRLTKIIRPGSSTNLSFDKNSFLTNIAHKKSSSDLINQFIYTRDNIGNRTSITSERGIASYTYDVESQLKTVSNTELSGDFANESFSYDDLGNRLNDQLGSYNYDSKSQRLTEDYKHIYTYDNNGNLTSIQEKGLNGNFKNLSYSSENQLIKIEQYKSNALIKTSQYFYDALGRRMRKNIIDHQNSNNSFERKFIYDGQEILAELDGNNNTLGVYTHSTLRTDDVLAVDVQNTKLANQVGSYFYLKDGLGSVIDIVDGSGNLVQHYAYSSFGKLLSIKDANNNEVINGPIVKTSYGFTNREYDEESGMMYYRARFYSPDIGRFIQEDPEPGRVGTPITLLSKYIYTGNNPIAYIDPSGRSFLSNVLAIGLTIAALYFTGGLIAGAASGAVSTLGITNVFAGQIVGGLVGSMLGGAIGGIAGGIGSQIGGGSWSEGHTIGSVIGSIYGGFKGALAGGTQSRYNSILNGDSNIQLAQASDPSKSVSSTKLNPAVNSKDALKCVSSVVGGGLLGGSGMAYAGYAAFIAGAATPVGWAVYAGIGIGAIGGATAGGLLGSELGCN